MAHSWGQPHGQLTSAAADTPPAPFRAKIAREKKAGENKHAPAGPSSHPMHNEGRQAASKDRRGRAKEAASITGLKRAFASMPAGGKGAAGANFGPMAGMGPESSGFGG